MQFQMTTQLAGQPFGVRYQETQLEPIVGCVHGLEVTIDHGDALQGHLGQPAGNVQAGQHAVDVGGLYQDQMAVVLGVVWNCDSKNFVTCGTTSSSVVAWNGSLRIRSRSAANLKVFMWFSFCWAQESPSIRVEGRSLMGLVEWVAWMGAVRFG